MNIRGLFLSLQWKIWCRLTINPSDYTSLYSYNFFTALTSMRCIKIRTVVLRKLTSNPFGATGCGGLASWINWMENSCGLLWAPHVTVCIVEEPHRSPSHICSSKIAPSNNLLIFHKVVYEFLIYSSVLQVCSLKPLLLHHSNECCWILFLNVTWDVHTLNAGRTRDCRFGYRQWSPLERSAMCEWS
jgi:hypothetical protein